MTPAGPGTIDWVVEGADAPLSDAAIEAIAALLVALVEQEESASSA